MPNVHTLVAKLHSVDPKIHPLLGTLPDPEPIIYDTTSETSDEHDDTAPKLYAKFFLHEMSDKNSGKKSFLHFQTERITMREIESENILNEVFPNLVFLGTGSQSSQYNRNASGILVNIS